MEVVFDPKDEADFRGLLSINLTGFDTAGAVVFGVKANLAVEDGLAAKGGGQ